MPFLNWLLSVALCRATNFNSVTCNGTSSEPMCSTLLLAIDHLHNNCQLQEVICIIHTSDQSRHALNVSQLVYANSACA